MGKISRPSFPTTYVQATSPGQNIPSLATALDETSAGRAEHDDDTIGDERPLEEMPSLTVKNMQSTSSRYVGRTLIGRIC
jgi:hypothetical protein